MEPVSKQKPLTDLWKRVKSDMIPCTYVLTKGERKDKPCNKPSQHGKCTLHSDKKVKPQLVPKKEPCMMFLRHGPQKNTRCKKIDCLLHQPIRVKLIKTHYVIKDTNLLFDLTEQVIIGYLKEDQFYFESNEEVKKGCIHYDVEYKKMN